MTEPLMPEEEAAVRERHRFDPMRGWHTTECASVRYPGGPFEPPDPCTCEGEDVARLLATLDAERKRARDAIEGLQQALRVAAHKPHDQLGEPIEGFPVCSVCGAIQTGTASQGDEGLREASANCAAGAHDDCAGMVEQDAPGVGITPCRCPCHTLRENPDGTLQYPAGHFTRLAASQGDPLHVERLWWLINTLPRQFIRADGNIGRREASAGRIPASGYVEVVSLAALRAALAAWEERG